MSGKKAIVLFFMPGCGHCVKMKPDVERSQEETGVPVLYADITVERKASNFFDVNGVPLLVKIDSGKIVSEFTGERSIKEISNFLQRNK